MKETTGNIWDHLGNAIICISTNGHLTKNGEAVLGRGCARQAQERFPDLPARLGALLSEGGNHVHAIGGGLVSFPWKSPWQPPPRPSGSTEELPRRPRGWPRIASPVRCGGGGLAWQVCGRSGGYP